MMASIEQTSTLTTFFAEGTKLHQQARTAISKRTPALLTAIRKFNKYCDELQQQEKPEWNFLLPASLPTELGPLREDASLLADVWVTRPSVTKPKWLEDPQIRTGIRAVLEKDRCLEERRRLGMEADNLCRSYGRELSAVELAMRNAKSTWSPRCTPQSIHHGSDAPIAFILGRRKEELLLLRYRWRTPFSSELQFQTQTLTAAQLAAKYSDGAEPIPLHWVHVNVPHTTEDNDFEDDVTDGDDHHCALYDIFETVVDAIDDDPNPEMTSPDQQSVIERNLWIYDTSPVSLHAKYLGIQLRPF